MKENQDLISVLDFKVSSSEKGFISVITYNELSATQRASLRSEKDLTERDLLE